MTQNNTPPQCWVLSDGRKGTENQCLGLAEAVGLPITMKRVHPKAPWRWLPEAVFGRPWPMAMRGLGSDSDPLSPEWPRLLIACGRQTVAYSVAIRRMSGNDTYTVQTQNPRIDPKFFDLVVPPKHDKMKGKNVMPIVGSPNRVTPELLETETKRMTSHFASLPRPLVAVMIGGNSRHFKLTPSCLEWLCGHLQSLIDEGYGLMITTSRRTGASNEAYIRTRLTGSNCMIWDGEGENPYFAMLGLADHILVTEESTNMVTEAAATGKPVHVIPLEGESEKFSLFHREMREIGATRPFIGVLESWTYEPINETARIAGVIRRKLNLSENPEAA